jgi:hypothetical protein
MSTHPDVPGNMIPSRSGAALIVGDIFPCGPVAGMKSSDGEATGLLIPSWTGRKSCSGRDLRP